MAKNVKTDLKLNSATQQNKTKQNKTKQNKASTNYYFIYDNF